MQNSVQAYILQDMSAREEELKSKMAAITQQDDVIRQYVHENTELKDRCSHIERQLEEQSEQLQKVTSYSHIYRCSHIDKGSHIQVLS